MSVVLFAFAAESSSRTTDVDDELPCSSSVALEMKNRFVNCLLLLDSDVASSDDLVSVFSDKGNRVSAMAIMDLHNVLPPGPEGGNCCCLGNESEVEYSSGALTLLGL